MKQVLIVVAHPDDEVLGCAGTIARHVKEGDKVRLLVMSGGEASRITQDDEGRRRSLECSSKLLGIASYQLEEFPDNALDSVPLLELVKKIESYAAIEPPNIVYTHFANDLNVDHELTARAVFTAFRPQPSSSVEAIYSFEVLSSTEWSVHKYESVFSPNYFVDITDTFALKIEALEQYLQELRPPPHSRSLENLSALATYRGMSVGLNKAEAFVCVRSLFRK